MAGETPGGPVGEMLGVAISEKLPAEYIELISSIPAVSAEIHQVAVEANEAHEAWSQSRGYESTGCFGGRYTDSGNPMLKKNHETAYARMHELAHSHYHGKVELASEFSQSESLTMLEKFALIHSLINEDAETDILEQAQLNANRLQELDGVLHRGGILNIWIPDQYQRFGVYESFRLQPGEGMTVAIHETDGKLPKMSVYARADDGIRLARDRQFYLGTHSGHTFYRQKVAPEGGFTPVVLYDNGEKQRNAITPHGNALMIINDSLEGEITNDKAAMAAIRLLEGFFAGYRQFVDPESSRRFKKSVFDELERRLVEKIDPKPAGPEGELITVVSNSNANPTELRGLERLTPNELVAISQTIGIDVKRAESELKKRNTLLKEAIISGAAGYDDHHKFEVAKLRLNDGFVKRMFEAAA